jgi:hypothetical protein
LKMMMNLIHLNTLITEKTSSKHKEQKERTHIHISLSEISPFHK